MIREAYFENYMRGYYAQILQIDDAVGELVRHLKAEGLYDDTLIVFTSDHGENGGSHGLYDKGVAFHEAAHVPAIFAGWDGIKHKGKVFDSLMSSVDIPVTIVHALELEATALGSPFIRKADGVNYSEYLTAQNPPRNSPRDHVYLQGRLNHTDNSPGNLNPSWRAIYTKDMIGLEGQWLYWMDAFTGEDRSLFHLFDGSGEAEDPFQRCNLVNQAQYGSELALLRARLDALRLDPGFGETVPHSLNPANGQRDVKWQKDGKVNVRWHGAAALPEDNEPRATVESYQVKWGTSPSDCDNGTVIPIENKDQADLNIGGAFGTFYWRVVAIPNEGDERPGECYSFTTIKDLAYSGGNPVHCESSNNDSVGPVPKEGMSVEPLDGDGNALSQFARLTWEGGSCARNYDVFIGFPGQSLTEIEHTTHLLSVVPAKATVPFQILPGKTHEWRVDARDGDGSARGPVNVTFQASNKLLFRASADAWVESGSRGRFGFEKKLSVSGRNPGPERHSYLRFDVEVPPNYEVDASRLRVFCLTAVDFGVYDCANGFFDCDNWPEGEMSGYEGLKKGALVTTGGGSKNEWATLELGKFLTSGGVRTFVLATMDPRERKLASRESRYVPFLELEVHELNP